jgi:hypothetical protein
MTRLSSVCLAGLLMVPLLPQGAAAQQCTTLGTVNQRHEEALRAVRMFNSAAAAERGALVVPSVPRGGAYPTWEQVGSAGIIGTWKTDGGPMGDLARRIRWGAEQPLPGWRMHWIAGADGYAFTLSDTRDRCGFSYWSDERGAILQGVLAEGTQRLVPVETN